LTKTIVITGASSGFRALDLHAPAGRRAVAVAD
jgi:NADP-dependent 3-hydroxy acid dehydrogenase YdfG